MSTIYEVVETNDWGYRTYSAGEFALTPEATKSVYVCWPSGPQELVPVEWQEGSEMVTDHGIASAVRSMRPYISIRHYGHLLRIPLAGLSISL